MAFTKFNSVSTLSILGVVVLVAGLAIAVIGAQQQQNNQSKAATPVVGSLVASGDIYSTLNSFGHVQRQTITLPIAGAEYKIVVSGTYKWNTAAYADADAQWARRSTSTCYCEHVNNVEFNFQGLPSYDFKTSANATGHVYTWYLTSATTTLVMNIGDSNYDDNTGKLHYTIYLNKLNDTTAPTTPTNLTASAVSASQINLSWTASTDDIGVTGYKIFRDGVQIATTTGTTYQNTGLTAATTYKYTVSGSDAAGNNSAKSNEASATTQATADTTPPSVPANLTATTISSSQINLSWTASTDNVGVTCYKIFRNGNQIALISSTTYQDVGLTSDTLYKYQVSACDAAGNNSAKSNEASATTQKPPSTTTKFNFDLFMHGLGKAGDAANPGESGGGNTSLVHFQRQILVDILDLDNTPFVEAKEGLVLFNSQSGSFKGTIEINPAIDIQDENLRPEFKSGSYVIKVKMDQSLRASLPKNVVVGGTANTLTTSLINGDINNDNKINIADYDILIGCYSDFEPPVDCDTTRKKKADIDDDGDVNHTDLNLFLRELSVQGGQ